MSKDSNYIKIETPFKRDMDGSKKLVVGDFRNEALEYLSPLNFEWTEKIDGCLRGDTKIKTFDGREIPIKEIVENKMDIEIMGMDDYGNVVPSKVIGWHNNGISNKWYEIRIESRGLGTRGNYFRTIKCTDNHKFYINGEYIQAKDLKVGDKVSFIRKDTKLNFIQKQIITGLLIGDGCRHDRGRCINFSQKKDNEEYIDWLLKALGKLGGNKGKQKISGYGTLMQVAKTISCQEIADFIIPFYNDNKKIIPKNIELSPIALAVIYMDDGSIQHQDGHLDRGVIALNDYDEESIDNLIDAIYNQLHIKGTKLYSKGWNIRFNTEDFEILQTLICPYICNCMQYKLSPNFRGKFIDIKEIKSYETINNVIQKEIISIEVKEEKHIRYDLTTETHNYFANGILVHNCNMCVRWTGHEFEIEGHTKKAQIPNDLRQYILNKFTSNEAEELIEQNFGETIVEFYGEGYGAGIQKGSGYSDEKKFIMFDIYLPETDLWLTRDSVNDIAQALSIESVPTLLVGTIDDAIHYVKTVEKTTIGKCEAPLEGVVGRPIVELKDRGGKRVIVKVKKCDFPLDN